MAFMFSRRFRTPEAQEVIDASLFLAAIFCHKPETQPEGHGRHHLTRCQRKSEYDQVLKPSVLTGWQ